MVLSKNAILMRAFCGVRAQALEAATCAGAIRVAETHVCAELQFPMKMITRVALLEVNTDELIVEKWAIALERRRAGANLRCSS